MSVAADRFYLQRCMEVSADSASICLEAEVPEALFDGLHQFMQAHPEWDQMRVFTSALATFLFQNGCNEASVTQHYLDGLFADR